MPARVNCRSPEEGNGLMKMSVLERGRSVAMAAFGVRAGISEGATEWRGKRSTHALRLTSAVLASLCALIAALLVASAPAFAAPEAPETGKATGITATSAQLGGVLNPNAVGEAGVYYFVFAPRGLACTEYGASVEAITPGFEKEVVAPVEVSGLEPSTMYAVCLVDRSEETGETTVGSSQSFMTLAAPPAVDSESTSAVNSTSATLEAQVNPNNQETSYSFEYSTQATGEVLEGSIVTAAGAGSLSGFGDQTASVPTGGVLEAGTTYFYRVIAKNAASEETEGKVERFTTVPAPSTDAPSPIAASAATLNGHVTLNSVDTQYSFEYDTGSECTGGSSTTPADAGTGTGSAPQSAEVTGLLPHTRYTVCFITSNAFGSEQGSPVGFTTLTAPPIVENEAVLDVSGDSTTFQAQINPQNTPVTYLFQYGTSETYGSTIPLVEATAGTGDTPITVEAHAQGLTPNTLYHYRLLATNTAHETTDGPDQTFTTQAAGTTFTLPDGRQYELVSPPSKEGARLAAIGAEGVIEASEDGSAISYVATAPTEPSAVGSRSPERVQLLSRRGPDGWTTRDIATPHDKAGQLAVGHSSEYKFFSPDLSLGLFEPPVATPLPPYESPELTPYLRENVSGTYLSLVDASNVPPGTGSVGRVQFVIATPDLKHIVLGSHVALTATPLKLVGGNQGIYEWSAGQLKLVNVMPESQGGKSAACATVGEEGHDVRHAISDDGSRIIWHDSGQSSMYECEEDQGLYMRDTSTEETIRLDALQGGAGHPTGREADFQLASADGSRVFFTDPEALSAGSTSSVELYEFEVTSKPGEKLAGKLTDITAPTAPGDSPGQVWQVVFGASEDGSYVYFVDSGVLAAGGHSGGFNLYVWHQGAVRFIASLSQADANWNKLAFIASLQDLPARVSPDGHYLAFMSQESLTGYDNRDAMSGAPDEEVFLYDAGAHHLRCVSCDLTGARPAGIVDSGLPEATLVDYANLWAGRWIAGNIPGWTRVDLLRALYESRYLSDSGRLFFDSADALVPQDTNGLEDVYEYEPGGVGTCTALDGCVELISSGTSGQESAFVDASASGNDVFFLTGSRLVSQDYDSSFDVYDAHVCAPSVPCASTPVTPPPCTTADSCRVAPSPQPTLFGSPPSATSSGTGNVSTSRGTAVKKVGKSNSTRRAKAHRKRNRSSKRRGRHASRSSTKAKKSLSSGIRR
jgi:hypothetical protein